MTFSFSIAGFKNTILKSHGCVVLCVPVWAIDENILENLSEITARASKIKLQRT